MSTKITIYSCRVSASTGRPPSRRTRACTALTRACQVGTPSTCSPVRRPARSWSWARARARDTLAFLRARLTVTAMDYAPNALAELTQAATAAGLADRLTTVAHDVRQPLPLPDGAVDAVYSHMLFNMALTTAAVEFLGREVRRVLRPGGWHIYTVRHTGDPHYGTGIPRGDNMTEHGGFIVHFFDRPLVNRLARTVVLITG